MSDNPLDQLNFNLLLCAAISAVTCVVNYALYPDCMPGTGGKVSLWSFSTGVYALPYMDRFAGGKIMTPEDHPQDAGTSSYNIHKFTSRILAQWTPQSEASLRSAIIRLMLPWYIHSHIFLGINRWLAFIGWPYFLACVSIYLHLPQGSEGMVAYKIAALASLQGVTQTLTSQCTEQVLALRASDPLWCGLMDLVVQKMHRLSTKGLMMTSSGEAQYQIKACRDLAQMLAGTPLKCFITVFYNMVIAILFLHAYHGAGILVAALVLSASVWLLNSWLTSKSVYWQAQFQGGLQHRFNVLNMILLNYKVLRMYDWMPRAAGSLPEVLDYIHNAAVKVKLWGAFIPSTAPLVDTGIVILAYILAVFCRGERVSFDKGLMTWVYMNIVSNSIRELSGCYGSWMGISMLCGSLERFLRLPEGEGVLLPMEGPARFEKASFAYPDKQPSVLESPTVPDNPSEGDADRGNSSDAVDKPSMENADITRGTGTAEKLMEESSYPLALTELDLNIEEGELILISGSMGSRKSTLLYALLGELPRVKGRAWRPAGGVVFQPQIPFLVEGTIRDNILFGLDEGECNEDCFQRAIVASQLAADMKDPRNTLYTLKDLTHVGKRGSQLSGGQRARTSLARSIYAALVGAKTLAILDDPVASVDNEMVQVAWDTAVLKEMHGLTRVIAVNTQLLERLAPTASRLVLLKEGRIAFNGAPADALQNQGMMMDILGGEYHLNVTTSEHLVNGAHDAADGATLPPDHDHHEVQDTTLQHRKGQYDHALDLAAVVNDWVPFRGFLEGTATEAKARSCTETAGVEANTAMRAESSSPLQLSPQQWQQFRQMLKDIEKKHRPSDFYGYAPRGAFKMMGDLFLRTRGLLLLPPLIGTLGSFRGSIQFAIVRAWESGHWGWTDIALCAALSATMLWQVVGDAIAGMASSMGTCSFCRSHQVGEDDVLSNLGMSFFWSDPGAETKLRKVFTTIEKETLIGIVSLPVGIAQTLIVSIITSIPMPKLWLVIAASFFGFRKVCMWSDWRTNQLIQVHDEVITRLDTRLLEQFDSLLTIRAFKREESFQRKLYPLNMMKVYHDHLLFGSVLLGSLLSELTTTIFKVFSIVAVTQFKSSGFDVPFTMGFYSLINHLSGSVATAVGMYMPFKHLLTQYRCVEDFNHTRHRERRDGDEPPADWPSQGHIMFEDVTFRYMPDAPAAISNLNLEVKAAEKLGIVGKTGSGKSTLVTLLLHLAPLQGVPPFSGGRVLIDGVDISTLNVGSLRRAVACVPQEPTIFDWMTVKQNVGEEYTDAEVITVLEKCGLNVRELTQQASYEVALSIPVGYLGLSTGQAQLMMVARALARRPKVLILDECTASLDRESVDKLLGVIKSECGDCTVLSIAHRLRFVLQSDRILVLDYGGKILALDTPARLMEDTEGYFVTNLNLELVQEEHQ